MRVVHSGRTRWERSTISRLDLSGHGRNLFLTSCPLRQEIDKLVDSLQLMLQLLRKGGLMVNSANYRIHSTDSPTGARILKVVIGLCEGNISHN
jgi:hypothetical protein